MLDAYDSAHKKANQHKVVVFHGKVAEATFRKWLGNFLPKRFGVTSGYIISQGIDYAVKAPHFDVIIYDKLESPILWVDGSPDLSPEGQSRAIPAEFVKAVIEVKSAFSKKTIKEVVKHLGELRPLLNGKDGCNEKYRKYLPDQFFCAAIFFELRSSDDKSGAKGKQTLRQFVVDEEIIPRSCFIGGLILRGENHQKPFTAKIEIRKSNEPLMSALDRQKHGLLTADGFKFSNFVSKGNHYLGARLEWHEIYFSSFAFGLVSRLKDEYIAGGIPSFYACGAESWEK